MVATPAPEQSRDDRGPIAEAARDYVQTVVPRAAGIDQRRGTKHAFFAGAWSVLQVINGLAELPEEDGVIMLGRLHAEADRLMRRAAKECRRRNSR